MSENIAGEGQYYCPYCEIETFFVYRWQQRTLQQAIASEHVPPAYGLCCTICQTPITQY
jgi:hypothetical protein